MTVSEKSVECGVDLAQSWVDSSPMNNLELNEVWDSTTISGFIIACQAQRGSMQNYYYNSKLDDPTITAGSTVQEVTDSAKAWINALEYIENPIPVVSTPKT